MNRMKYFNYIESKLNELAYRISARGKLNILDLNIHSENFFLHLFNKLYNWDLKNLNEKIQNVEAIDLIDSSNKIIIQVSATNSKVKVQNSLNKNIQKKYSGYNYKFISIAGDAGKLRQDSYSIPSHLRFVPSDDIYDMSSILKNISALNIAEQKEIYTFIKDELGHNDDGKHLDSNITAIIYILSKVDLNFTNANKNIIDFSIEQKIDFNELYTCKSIIMEYSKHYKVLNEKYNEFDRQGANKSLSVLHSIKGIYLKEVTRKKGQSADNIFLNVVEGVVDIVLESANCNKEMTIDEIELCVKIIVVDAFTRCEIFDNPSRGLNVIA